MNLFIQIYFKRGNGNILLLSWYECMHIAISNITPLKNAGVLLKQPNVPTHSLTSLDITHEHWSLNELNLVHVSSPGDVLFF